MEWFGFVVAAPLVAPVVAQTAAFVGLALTTVGSVLGIKAAIEAAKPKPPQLPAGEPVAFEPWGDDPYEEPAPEPEPITAPLAESSPAPSPAPPLTPVQEPPEPEAAAAPRDPQSPLTPEFLPVPQPVPPGGPGRLGGHSWSVDLGSSPLSIKIQPRYGNWSIQPLSKPWSAISYEVIERLEDGQRRYQPAIRLLNGQQTTHYWQIDELLDVVPSISKYSATVFVPLDDGSIDELNIDFFVSTTKTLYRPLTRTFTPTPIPQPEPEPEQLLVPQPEPLPLPQPEVEEEPMLPPPLPEPSEPVVTPELPDAVPLPTLPTYRPILDEDGKPIYVQPVPITPPTSHPIDTPDGPITIPGGSSRPDLSSIASELQRVEGKTAQILKNTHGAGGVLDRLPEILLLLQGLADLFEQPLPAKEYSISGVCEEPLEDGKQPSTTVILPPEKFADRLISQSDVIPDLLQAHLGYKTPVCLHATTQLEGTWISTRWESDGVSPGGTKPLRKLFRYRSKSTRTADELQLYWRDFVWEAGGVIVTHKGAWWGNPQVWAASVEEGKRVIRFAAGEAGLDPDQVGEWAVSSSRSPRYGMSGRMRLEEHQGERWVTRRDGPSGLPEL